MLAIVGILQFLFQIRTILLWVLIGVILAIALQPAVGWLERHRWNRILASLLVSFGTVAVLVGVVIAVAYPVVFQADDFIRALPRILDNLFGTGGQLNFLETRFHVLERVASVTPGAGDERRPRQPGHHLQRGDQGRVHRRRDHHHPHHHGHDADRGAARLALRSSTR